MKVIFRDEKLERLLDNDPSKLKFPEAVIDLADLKIGVLREVTDLRALKKWKSLRCKKLKRTKSGLYSIRLNKQYRLLFRVIISSSPATIEIVSIED